MTTDEIKSNKSMRDVLSMYGIHPNRAGFIHCPFHNGDRTPSCKIYKNDYHCHACGANGDIFSFVQGMENCSFKEAFKILGGTYEEKSDYQHKIAQYRIEKKKEAAERKERKIKAEKRMLYQDIKMQRLFAMLFPVFSDEWCDAVNTMEADFIRIEELNCIGGETD